MSHARKALELLKGRMVCGTHPLLRMGLGRDVIDAYFTALVFAAVGGGEIIDDAEWSKLEKIGLALNLDEKEVRSFVDEMQSRDDDVKVAAAWESACALVEANVVRLFICDLMKAISPENTSDDTIALVEALFRDKLSDADCEFCSDYMDYLRNPCSVGDFSTTPFGNLSPDILDYIAPERNHAPEFVRYSDLFRTIKILGKRVLIDERVVIPKGADVVLRDSEFVFRGEGSLKIRAADAKIENCTFRVDGDGGNYAIAGDVNLEFRDCRFDFAGASSGIVSSGGVKLIGCDLKNVGGRSQSGMWCVIDADRSLECESCHFEDCVSVGRSAFCGRDIIMCHCVMERCVSRNAGFFRVGGIGREARHFECRECKLKQCEAHGNFVYQYNGDQRFDDVVLGFYDCCFVDVTYSNILSKDIPNGIFEVSMSEREFDSRFAMNTAVFHKED